MAVQPPQVRSYTVSDYQAWISRAENADRLFELIDGAIVEKVPTEEHSIIAGNLYFALRLFAESRSLGRVLFEARHQLPGDDRNARLPDVEFTRQERVQPVITDGGIPQTPDLAVEIKSPTDRYSDLRKKALYYLENGTLIVWLVYPAKQQVEVWTADYSQTVGEEDTLDGGDVLPGFSVAVKAIFKVG